MLHLLIWNFVWWYHTDDCTIASYQGLRFPVIWPRNAIENLNRYTSDIIEPMDFKLYRKILGGRLHDSMILDFSISAHVTQKWGRGRFCNSYNLIQFPLKYILHNENEAWVTVSSTLGHYLNLNILHNRFFKIPWRPSYGSLTHIKGVVNALQLGWL